MTINYQNPGENWIFVTSDTSDIGIGTILFFGPTWETTCPVAFKSAQLNSIEQNYPIYEKELLTIMHTLSKWCCDLLGTPFVIHSDYYTFENFA